MTCSRDPARRVLVLGAGGPTGREVSRAALSQGHHVTAVTRRPARFPLHHPRLQVTPVDVRDAEGVEQVVEGHDVVLSAFGVLPTGAEVDVYSVGTAHVVQAMARHGVRRLVCVSSPGVCEEMFPGGSWFSRLVMQPLLHRVNRTVYDDMRRMEQVVAAAAADIDATVVRPYWLFQAGGRQTRSEMSTGRLRARYTSFGDLADAMLRLGLEGDHVGEVVEVATVSGTPSLPAMVLQQLRPGRG